MKHITIFCLITLLLCGCTTVDNVPPSAPSSETTASLEAAWYDFRDLAGDPITLDTGLNAVDVSYTLGWNPNQEGYIRLEDGMAFGDIKISYPNSRYYLYPQQDGSVKPICNRSEYTLYCDTTISGILQADAHAVVFFPYENEEIPLFILHPRTKNREKGHTDATHLVTIDGTELQIKPDGIQFDQRDQDALLELLELDDLTTARWYDVDLSLSDIYISGFADGADVELFGTRAHAYLPHDETGFPLASSLTIKGELSFSDLIGSSFMFWIFRYDP